MAVNPGPLPDSGDSGHGNIEMMEDQEERDSEEPKDTEGSVGTGTLELVEREEEILPEELPKWAGVDHSKL